MAADTRYLKKRHQGWYFDIAVPRRARASFGRSRVTVSLRTQSLDEAQRLRWEEKLKWQRAFEQHDGSGSTLSPTDIDALAIRNYDATLAQLQASETKRGRRRPEVQDDGETLVDPEAEELQGEAWALEEALEQESYEGVANEIAQLNVALSETDEAYSDLARALLRAKFEAVSGRLRALRGQPTPRPVTFIGRDGIDLLTLQPVAQLLAKATVFGLRISEAVTRYVEEIKRDPNAKATDQTIAQNAAVFRLFEQFAKDALLASITRADASRFLDTVASLHPHWGRSPKTKSLSLDEILRKFGGGSQKLTNKTLNRYSSALSGLYKWARKRGLIEGTVANPFSEQGRQKAKRGTTGWLPYNSDELNRLFGAPLFHVDAEERLKTHTTANALRWVSLIGLFSGMRLEEIAQLVRDDIRNEKDVWFFNVTDEGEGQQLKTSNAKRRVPVHGELIRCGLLQYLEALPAHHLFPSLRPSRMDGKLSAGLSKRFTEYRRECGVDRPRVGFHSFRKNVASALDAARVPQADVATLLGHETTFSRSTYSEGPLLVTLQEHIDRVGYPGVVLTHLHI